MYNYERSGTIWKILSERRENEFSEDVVDRVARRNPNPYEFVNRLLSLQSEEDMVLVPNPSVFVPVRPKVTEEFIVSKSEPTVYEEPHSKYTTITEEFEFVEDVGELIKAVYSFVDCYNCSTCDKLFSSFPEARMEELFGSIIAKYYWALQNTDAKFRNVFMVNSANTRFTLQPGIAGIILKDKTSVAFDGSTERKTSIDLFENVYGAELLRPMILLFTARRRCTCMEVFSALEDSQVKLVFNRRVEANLEELRTCKLAFEDLFKAVKSDVKFHVVQNPNELIKNSVRYYHLHCDLIQAEDNFKWTAEEERYTWATV